MVIAISILAFLMTLFGGLFALRFTDKLHLILGFSAGAVIGVAFFDLLPEALELSRGGYELSTITALVALGFVIFLLLDRFLGAHGHSDEDCENMHHKGTFGASSLIFHSFLDGIAIGLAFQVGNGVGIVVALAVLAHDFSDGINTASIILKGGSTKKEAFRWVMTDALAPVVGVIATLFFTLPQTTLGIVLAIFCGFFLYIGASDLLPESHHRHPTRWTTIATIIGMFVLYFVIQIAHI